VARLDSIPLDGRLNYITGASMLVSRSFLEIIGLMSEDYFLYFEELDWSCRARNKFTLAYAPESIVYHKHRGSITKGAPINEFNMVSEYYPLKSKIIFTRKFFPYTLPTIYFNLILAIINSIIKKQWKRAVLILKIMFGFTWNKQADSSE